MTLLVSEVNTCVRKWIIVFSVWISDSGTPTPQPLQGMCATKRSNILAPTLIEPNFSTNQPKASDLELMNIATMVPEASHPHEKDLFKQNYTGNHTELRSSSPSGIPSSLEETAGVVPEFLNIQHANQNKFEEAPGSLLASALSASSSSCRKCKTLYSKCDLQQR